MSVVYKTRGGLKLTTPCILCTCCIEPSGYGRRSYKGKTERAHRVAYAEYHGLTMEQIKGVIVRHECDTPACINGEHLIPGTHADNVKDRQQRGRHRWGTLKGEAHPKAKLTEEQVREIKLRIKNGQYRKTIAKEFGVSTQTISAINTGKNWAHVVVSD